MAINVAQEVATHRHMSMSAENFMGTHHFDIFRQISWGHTTSTFSGTHFAITVAETNIGCRWKFP